jgi:hypothetical protein
MVKSTGKSSTPSLPESSSTMVENSTVTVSPIRDRIVCIIFGSISASSEALGHRPSTWASSHMPARQ